MTVSTESRRSGEALLWLFVAPALLGLIGCAPTTITHGYQFDKARLAQIQPGRSSREDVQQILGSPTLKATFDDNTWYYSNQTFKRASFYQNEVIGQEVVQITFDDLGIVANIERHGLQEAREVDPVDRETPTSGNELTMFEQFIGNIGRFNPPAEE